MHMTLSVINALEMSDRPAAVVIQCSNHDVVPWAWLIKVKELDGSVILSIKSICSNYKILHLQVQSQILNLTVCLK